MRAAAEKYNESLRTARITLTDPFDPEVIESQGSGSYMSLLNHTEDGIMGYLRIPVIKVNLPIYHGTSADVLEKGVGHLEQSSLPIGGPGTHSVITGHTGMAGKRILTDLTEMKEGDIFYIHMLGEILAYEVSGVQIVEPEETSSLTIVDGEDKVTIVTCYPYGINSHRLLVTGTRTEYTEALEKEKSQARDTESVWQNEYVKGILICLAIYIPLIILGIFLIRKYRRRDGEAEKNEKPRRKKRKKKPQPRKKKRRRTRLEKREEQQRKTRRRRRRRVE